MKRGHILSVVAAVALAVLTVPRPVERVCDGFLPENDLSIPIGSMQDKGITKQKFDAVIDTVEELYSGVVADQGGVLQVRRRWEDDTVNAYAQRSGNNYIVTMFGGLARHEAITQDGFALVVCHELGHHIGGAPKKSGWWGSWASNEGQSDYYANLKCLRRVFTAANATAFSRPAVKDDFAAKTCEEAFGDGQDKALCVRNAAAGMSVTALFRALRNEEKEPRFDTPDPNVVDRTADSHPATQCRLDAYFQGSLCTKDVSEAQDDTDPAPGTCMRAAGYTLGVRPLCWFKPPAKEMPSIAGVRKTLDRPESTLSSLKSETLWQGL